LIVDQSEKKERGRRTKGTAKKMSQEKNPTTTASASYQAAAAEDGLSPNLQAHIGRHLRAAFDEIAREPIPDRLLQLLKDLERSGGK
jgi:hypothetical protein